ncbi:MAG: glycosyltransferase family 4 protein, partial [Clostridia bacterium]|nr:glycosyltransferase family 4 protein [Clostridia bacterium]
FFSGIYSPVGVKGMRDVLHREKPDVVNIHNLYPFISPAALFECKKAGVPVVMTIHNFRLICPTGLFMRNGEPCEYCLSKGNEWGCVKYNCEHSLMKSVGYAARNAVARITGAYAKCVDRFACITEFQRQKLIAAGFDPEKIVVIPNAIDSPAERKISVGKYVAYSGRLSREKGVDLIIEVARRHPEIPFRFAGAVRDAAMVNDLPGNVSRAGYLSGAALEDFYKNASFFVMASRWYEGFPMTILEAARYGKPTVGPDHGGFTEIIGKGEQSIGKLFKPADVEDLERQVVELWNTPEDVVRLGSSAFDKLRSRYSVEVISRQWQQLFNHIIGRK